MSTRKEQSEEIRDYILANVSEHKNDIVTFASNHFGLSRQAIFRYVKALVHSNDLIDMGTTKARSYILAPLDEFKKTFQITPELDEFQVWTESFGPRLKHLNRNVYDICLHGFTEILNNAVDHSEGTEVTASISVNAASVSLLITDNGIGIFNKIQQRFSLSNQHDAILQLTKGKMTSDPTRHSGEGIFFTSRMFDVFSIWSGNLVFQSSTGDDWLIETITDRGGSWVQMQIKTSAQQTSKEVFDKYTAEHDEYGFTRTHVPLTLARVGDENLISRSQAKRVLARVDKFKEVLLDFNGVESIGQAFADEIFRVFANAHPDIQLQYVNANDDVRKMILRAQNTTL